MVPLHPTTICSFHFFSFATARSPRIGKDAERFISLTRVVVDQEAGCLWASPLPQGQEVPCRWELPSTPTLPGSNQGQLQNQRKQKNHIGQQTTSGKRWINTLKTDIQQNAFVYWEWYTIFRLLNTSSVKKFWRFYFQKSQTLILHKGPQNLAERQPQIGSAQLFRAMKCFSDFLKIQVFHKSAPHFFFLCSRKCQHARLKTNGAKWVQTLETWEKFKKIEEEVWK